MSSSLSEHGHRHRSMARIIWQKNRLAEIDSALYFRQRARSSCRMNFVRRVNHGSRGIPWISELRRRQSVLQDQDSSCRQSGTRRPSTSSWRHSSWRAMRAFQFADFQSFPPYRADWSPENWIRDGTSWDSRRSLRAIRESLLLATLSLSCLSRYTSPVFSRVRARACRASSLISWQILAHELPAQSHFSYLSLDGFKGFARQGLACSSFHCDQSKVRYGHDETFYISIKR